MKTETSKRKAQVIDFITDINLGFLTFWGFAVGAVAAFFAANLWLFSLLLGVGAFTSVVVGKFSEARILRKTQMAKKELQEKIDELDGRLKKLKEYYGFDDEYEPQ